MLPLGDRASMQLKLETSVGCVSTFEHTCWYSHQISFGKKYIKLAVIELYKTFIPA
jgi:hypothetical protein